MTERAKLLEDLEPGTPVRTCDGEPAGEIRGVYASGETRDAAFLLVYWNERSGEALVGADEVMRIGDDGVELRSSMLVYRELAAFDPSHNALLHRIA